MFSKLKIRSNVESLDMSPTLKVALSQKEAPLLWSAGFGESAFPLPDCFNQAFQSASHFKYYASCQGEDSLRSAISEYYSKEFNLSSSPEDIIIFPGSKQAFFSLGAILGKSCYILPQGSWVSYQNRVVLLCSASDRQHLKKLVYGRHKLLPGWFFPLLVL